MSFEIIDFHTHPFTDEKTNICQHKEFMTMSPDTTAEIYRSLGVSHFAGSVLYPSEYGNDHLAQMLASNERMLELKQKYGELYIPGFHIHPCYPEESISEIHRMNERGIKLIGELVPYMCGWQDYSRDDLSPLLDEAARYNMIVSFHSSGNEEMDKMVKRHPDLIFVAAHPGEFTALCEHIERMKKYDNYYLDISGTGLFRYGCLRRIIDAVGSDRLFFGSDYPICSPAMFLGGVLLDSTLSDTEKENILSNNAKKLLAGK